MSKNISKNTTRRWGMAALTAAVCVGSAALTALGAGGAAHGDPDDQRPFPAQPVHPGRS